MAEMTFLELRAAVAAWLRYDRRCPIIAFERAPWPWSQGRPDVMAITAHRHWIEVEIKMTIRDWRADAAKHKWWGELDPPRQFYYAVPPDLEAWGPEMCANGAGLLMPCGYSDQYGVFSLRVARKATIHPSAPRVPLREIIDAVKDMSGTLAGLAGEIARAAKEVRREEPERA